MDTELGFIVKANNYLDQSLLKNFWHLWACFCTHRGMQTHTQSQESVHPVDLAAMVEDRIHESLLNSPTAFHLDSARLYGVNIGPHAGTEELMLSFILENGDIYDLLDTPESACARLFDAAALVTCGWAAVPHLTAKPHGAA
jgi:hypothetical protein